MKNDTGKSRKLTTDSGKPYVDHENSMSVGPRGLLLLQDHTYQEKMAHFNRERIPERIVPTKGSGAFGTFTVTHDISKYTRAKVFNKIGKQTGRPACLRGPKMAAKFRAAQYGLPGTHLYCRPEMFLFRTYVLPAQGC